MSVYTPTYGPVYGGGFPLDLQIALRLGGAWTDITAYAYNRTTPAFTVTRGRPDETAQVSPSSMSGQLNNRDGRFTSRNPTGPYYGQLGRNTPVRLSVPAKTTALRLEDDTVSYAATGSATGLTGDIDIRLEMNLSGWAPGSLCGQSSWGLLLNGDGTLALWISGSVRASSTMPVPLGHVAVRCTRVASSGLTTFYTADTISGTWVQLGATATAGGTLSATAAPFVVGIDILPASVTGLIYEFQAYAGIAGTLKADAQFTAQSAGATSWTDPQGNTWTVNGTATIDGRSYRYHGEMSSLPVAWDPSGRDIWVPFQAGGLLRRLQQGTTPVLSAMRRAILQDALFTTLLAYWPCEDGTGATQIASGLPGGQAMLIGAGSPAFQNQPGAPSADQSFDCSAALPQVGQSTWAANVPIYTSAGTDVATFLLLIPSGGLGLNTTLMTVAVGSAGHSVSAQYSTGSGGSLNLYNDSGSLGTAMTGVNGVPLLVQLSNTPGTTTCTLTALPLGPGAVPAVFSSASGFSGHFHTVTINPNLDNEGQTEIGQIAVTTVAAQDITTLQDAFNAHTGETAGNRFARLCAENSVAARIYGYPDITQPMGAQPIDTLTAILQSCEDADRGMMYEPSECLGLGYRTLASMCNQVPAVTLDYSAAEVGDQENSPVSLTSVDDDQYTRNDITLTRQSGNTTGSSVQAQLDDGSAMSISPPESGGVGDYASSTDVNTETDAQLPDIAQWMVHVGTVSEERYPQVVTGLHRLPIIATGLGFTIQDVRIGDYVAVENTPAWLPPGDIKQVVAGVTETLTSFLFQVSWNAVPESPYEPAILDDPVTGRLDTDGSTLHANITSGATTMQVDTTNAASPLWTTDASGGAGPQILIPLYDYPGSPLATFWTDVIAAAPTTGIIIGNPASGPGTSADPNWVAAFAAAHDAGITVVGYVFTSFGARAAADAEADIAMWETLYGITDIFFDEVSTSAADIPYYRGLISYVRGGSRTATVVLNPGTIPDQGYFSTGADVICVCEDAYANLAADAAAAPAWLFAYEPSMISVVVNQCATSGNMATALGLAQSAFNAGFVWVTADAVYGAEPSYFATEVSDIAALTGTGDFPFDVAMGGEQIAVTAVTGTSSPQTFTVVRSKNGVVKAQTAGADVRLFSPPVPALT